MLNTITRCLDEASNKYDVLNKKIDVYVESILNQYEINCKRAELKILTETGTTEDLIYFETQAENGVVEGIKKAIEKTIDSFIAWVNEIKLKILTLITKKETKNAIDEMDKKIKFNPFLSNKQVQVEDTKKQLKVVTWANAEYAKLLSKIKSGKSVTMEQINRIKEEFKSRLRAASGIQSAVKVKLKEAGSMLKKAGENMADNIEAFSKNTKELMQDAKEAANGAYKEAATQLKAIGACLSTIGKDAITAIVNFWKSTLAVIRAAVSKIKNKPVDNDSTVEESVNNNFEDDDRKEVKTEEADDILKSIEDELFSESENIENIMAELFSEETNDDFEMLCEESEKMFSESVEELGLVLEGKNKDAQDILAKMKKEVFPHFKKINKLVRLNDFDNAKMEYREAKMAYASAYQAFKSIEFDDYSIKEMLCGRILLSWTIFLRTIIAGMLTIPFGGIGGTIVGWAENLRSIVDDINKIINDVKDGEITVQTFNSTKNRVDGMFKRTAKELNKMDDLINTAEKAFKEKESVKKESTDDSIDEWMKYFEEDVLN